MSRCKLAAGYSVVLAALLLPSVHAQDQRFDPRTAQPQMIPAQIPDQSGRTPQQIPSRNASYNRTQDPTLYGVPPQPIDANLSAVTPGVPVAEPGYVRLGAPLYPSPRPNIPIWTGSTMITNQALAPHEMLYPHTYRALYPPYYHRVKGSWLLTPIGVRSHEKWELQGTMVQVKYRSHYPGLTSGAYWHPPATSYMGGSWR